MFVIFTAISASPGQPCQGVHQDSLISDNTTLIIVKFSKTKVFLAGFKHILNAKIILEMLQLLFVFVYYQPKLCTTPA